MTYTNLEELNRIETEYGTVVIWSRDVNHADGTVNKEYEAFLTFGGAKTWNFVSVNLVTVLKRFGKYIEKLNERAGYTMINMPQYN